MLLCALQGDASLQQLSSLLDAANAKDAGLQLQAMHGCRCPVVWHMFSVGLLSPQSTARSTSLQQLQLQAAKQQLERLVNGTVDQLDVQDLAKHLLMTGLHFKPKHAVQPAVTATERVQQQLWDNVRRGMPEVRPYLLILHQGRCPIA